MLPIESIEVENREYCIQNTMQYSETIETFWIFMENLFISRFLRKVRVCISQIGLESVTIFLMPETPEREH